MNCGSESCKGLNSIEERILQGNVFCGSEFIREGIITGDEIYWIYRPLREFAPTTASTTAPNIDACSDVGDAL
jgi:hypothetical protein